MSVTSSSVPTLVCFGHWSESGKTVAQMQTGKSGGRRKAANRIAFDFNREISRQPAGILRFHRLPRGNLRRCSPNINLIEIPALASGLYQARTQFPDQPVTSRRNPRACNAGTMSTPHRPQVPAHESQCCGPVIGKCRQIRLSPPKMQPSIRALVDHCHRTTLVRCHYRASTFF